MDTLFTIIHYGAIIIGVLIIIELIVYWPLAVIAEIGYFIWQWNVHGFGSAVDSVFFQKNLLILGGWTGAYFLLAIFGLLENAQKVKVLGGLWEGLVEAPLKGMAAGYIFGEMSKPNKQTHHD